MFFVLLFCWATEKNTEAVNDWANGLPLYYIH
jgi:hypothetical protein